MVKLKYEICVIESIDEKRKRYKFHNSIYWYSEEKFEPYVLEITENTMKEVKELTVKQIGELLGYKVKIIEEMEGVE